MMRKSGIDFLERFGEIRMMRKSGIDFFERFGEIRMMTTRC